MAGAADSSNLNILIQSADFAVKYGFLAIGLLLILLIAPAVYRFSQSRLLTWVSVSFGLAFVIAFGALDLSNKLWRERTFVSGTVLGITNGFQVQVRSDIRQAGQAYTKREVDPENGTVFNFPFILATRDAPGCLVVSIASTDPNWERIFAFNIAPVTDDDLRADTEVVIEAVPRAGEQMVLNVWREQGQKRVGPVLTLEPLDATASDCSRGGSGATVTGWLFRPAFAQGFDPAALERRLNSDDTFTRRDARIELAAQGPAAFDAIADFIASGTHRVQMGAVVALGGMPAEQRCAAPPALLDAVRGLAASDDEGMRDAVRAALAGC
jgi:hypothetical protein